MVVLYTQAGAPDIKNLMDNTIRMVIAEPITKPIDFLDAEFTPFHNYRTTEIHIDPSYPHYIEVIEAMNEYECRTMHAPKILVASPNFYKNLWAEIVHGKLAPLPLEIAVAPNNGELADSFFVSGNPTTDLITVINREQSFSQEEE